MPPWYHWSDCWRSSRASRPYSSITAWMSVASAPDVVTSMSVNQRLSASRSRSFASIAMPRSSRTRSCISAVRSGPPIDGQRARIA